jgi:DNA polymerase-3 subunit epsilon
VLSHFAADHRATKDARLVQQVRRLEWKVTVGELGALLEEARLVKELLPVHNRQLRRSGELCAYAWDCSGDKPPRLVDATDLSFQNATGIYGVFRSPTAARETLRNLAQAFELCAIALGLEKGPGPCFAHQLKRCRGLCVGKEPRASHNLRLMEALSGIRLKAWPYGGRIGVRERSADRSEVHVLDQWRYLGTLRSEQDLETLCTAPRFDLDTYRILSRFFAKRDNSIEIFPFAA